MTFSSSMPQDWTQHIASRHQALTESQEMPCSSGSGSRKENSWHSESGGNPSFFSSSLFSQATAPKSSLGQQEPAGPELWMGRTLLWVQQNRGSKRMWPKLAIFFLSLVFLSVFLYCLHWGCGHRCGSTWQNRIMKSNFLVKKKEVWWN